MVRAAHTDGCAQPRVRWFAARTVVASTDAAWTLLPLVLAMCSRLRKGHKSTTTGNQYQCVGGGGPILVFLPFVL